MPIYITGSTLVGPRAAGGAANLPAYLQSIGKASWYGGYKVPLQLFSDIGNTTLVTTDNAAWRNWLPNWSAGGWSASFGQSNGPRRCAYGASRNGKPGIYADGVDWFANLSSTTALNLQHTVLISAWVTCAAGPPCLYSHANQAMRYECPTATGNQSSVFAASTKKNFNASHVQQATPVDASSYALRIGWSTDPASTQHHNNAPNLFRSSSDANYSSSTIYELWFVPWLTPAEITDALKFLA